MSGDFLSVTLDGRQLGLPALRVREVVRLPAISRVAGSPPMVAGVMNLRGQVVTAIDLRARLGLPARERGGVAMGVMIDVNEHVYALVVDSVGDVIAAAVERQEAPPATLSPLWRRAATAVQREAALVLILDIDALLQPEPLAA
jgi:purine-binding chemotaxis protein CheW